jgi:uncharacterized membrane protein
MHNFLWNANRTRRVTLTSWMIPLLYTIVTMAVSLLFPRFEHHYMPALVTTMSPSAAMAICSSIASGMIALTGIVFSLTFVMVQFSATAYSPRLVMWVAREPVVSHALGVFIATFLYPLGMLAWVDRNASGTVPFISTWMVVGLLLVSMAMFIALIERISMLQVNRMLMFTHDQGRKAIDELYLARSGSVAAPARAEEIEKMTVSQIIHHTGHPRVVQAIDMAALVRLASTSGALIQVVPAVGDTVIELSPLFRVRGGHTPLDPASLRNVVDLGEERTFDQDPKYAIRLIVDIAIKALSPAVNDPTTAVQALDQIEDLLLRLGSCSLEDGTFRDSTGTVRVVISFPTWENFLRLALEEIRFYGADSVQVMRRMKALITNLIELLPAERQPALQYCDRRLQDSITRSFKGTEDQQTASVADRQGLGIGC